MNILYLVNHLNTGGITSYVLSLAGSLKQKGHNVYVASSGGELLSRFQQQAVTHIPIPIKTKSEASPKILFSLLKLSGFIKDNRIDIIHANSRTTQVLGCLLGKVTGTPYISTCHGFFKRRLSRRIFPCWGKKVIAISQQVAEHLTGDLGVPRQDIIVINNGIDVARFRQPNSENRELNKTKLGLGPGPVIGIIARLSDVKGHIYLIEAMKEVVNKLPGAQLLIVGEGRMGEELRALSQRLGIAKNVFFIASAADTRDVLSVMDLFVLPSLEEGLGLALMEAMAFGLAVVGSDIGGIKTLIQDGANGLLVKPKDSRGLARAILELLRDKEKAASLARQARIFIEENFSQEKMVLETQELYRQCLGAN